VPIPPLLQQFIDDMNAQQQHVMAQQQMRQAAAAAAAPGGGLRPVQSRPGGGGVRPASQHGVSSPVLPPTERQTSLSGSAGGAAAATGAPLPTTSAPSTFDARLQMAPVVNQYERVPMLSELPNCAVSERSALRECVQELLDTMVKKKLQRLRRAQSQLLII
jgi:hypothetical protein